MKRSKHRIAYAGQQMEATGLLINQHGAGLKQRKRSAARTAVFQCELEARENPDSDALPRMKRRALSTVGQCARFHKTEGQSLKQRLDNIVLPKL